MKLNLLIREMNVEFAIQIHVIVKARMVLNKNDIVNVWVRNRDLRRVLSSKRGASSDCYAIWPCGSNKKHYLLLLARLGAHDSHTHTFVHVKCQYIWACLRVNVEKSPRSLAF